MREILKQVQNDKKKDWIPGQARNDNKRRLVGTEEAARVLGVTPRAIRKWFANGRLEGEIKEGWRTKGKLFVWIDDERPLASLRGGAPSGAEPVGDPPHRPAEDGDHPPGQGPSWAGGNKEGGEGTSIKLDGENPDRNKVHPGEPGCRVVTELRNGAPVLNEVMPLINDVPAIVSSPTEEPVISDQLPVISQKNVPEKTNLPAVSTPLPPNPKLERKGNLIFALLGAIREEVSKNHRPKTKAVKEIVEMYNSGFFMPEIFKEIGPRKKSTINNWDRLEREGGVDALIPQYRGPQVSDIAPAEKQFLLTKLLHQNKPTIGDSINKCKFLLGDMSSSSPAKLRRFVNDFRRQNFDLWTLEREGQKALNDKCVPYAEREWRDLAVGEAVVADGHKLNFQVINPFTGKPMRAMMVLFWDWKSAFPLGWEIMLTESIQCVVAALRNAIITLGKFPKHALLDNGKAFRASIFVKKFRFEETEIPGIFDRLNIQPHFAMPYNAQSKPIERFFRTFNDWFERELPSYTGASINDKPARLHRNEKRAIALHDDWVPTIPEAMELVFKWREYYITQSLRARDGQTPYDIFSAEKGPGVDPFALHFLMMAAKSRMVHRNGITFNGWHWYHDSLYGLKDSVIMFYSYYDLSQVYIFSMTSNGSPGEFLCAAKPVEKVKPFAADSEFPEDMAAVKRIVSTKRKLVQTTKKLADMLQSEKQVYVDWNRTLRDRPEVASAIKQIKDKEGPKLISLSTKEEIENYEVKEDESRPPATEHFFETYDLLMKKETHSSSEEKWVDEYRSGIIAPGEWKTIYGACEGG